jgi:hypothetical protein
MTDDKIYDDPSEVSAEDGVVSVQGPDAVDVQMTPEAADETSDRLLRAAMRAKGQQLVPQALKRK